MIRRAIYNDIPQMVSLLSQLFSIEDDFTIDSAKQKRGLELLIEHSDAVVLIAVIEERIVGMVTMQRLISTAMGEPVGLVEDMIVSHDFRRRGIGKVLLEQVIQIAVELGYARVALGADIRNDPALEFYHCFGFERSNLGLLYKSL